MPQLSQTCFLVPGPTASECAAWVQAWGSILAILVAIAIAYFQHLRELSNRRAAEVEARAKLLTSASQLVYAVQAVCEKVVRSEHTTAADLRSAVSELQAIKTMLNKFSPAELHEFHELEPIVVAAAVADRAADFIERALDSKNQMGLFSMKDVFSALIEEVKKHADRISVVADTARRDAGATRKDVANHRRSI